MGGREGKPIKHVKTFFLQKGIETKLFSGNFGLELDADMSSGRSSGDIDTFLCIQMSKV